jgi:hypothetical protein
VGPIRSRGNARCRCFADGPGLTDASRLSRIGLLRFDSAATDTFSRPTGRFAAIHSMRRMTVIGLSTLSYRAMGLVRENATSFFMQRILFLQLSHSP